MTLNNSSYTLLVCWICLFLAEVCEARFRATRFRFRYTTYSSYGSSGSSSSLGAGAIAGIVSGSIVFTIILICIIVCCCSQSKKGKGANKGVVLQYNPANSQKIVTSNSMAGVTYPSKASANMATPRVNFPSQPYPHGAQYNTAFQYGIQDPNQKYDTYSGKQFDNVPPSYESLNGHNNRSAVSPNQTQGKMLVSNIKMPSQQKK